MSELRKTFRKALEISDGGRSLSELLRSGVDASAIVVHFHLLSALHYAAERGSAISVHFLLDAGANVDARDKEGNTALHYAGQLPPSDAFDVVRELLIAQPDLNIFNKEGRSALHVAARNGCWDVVSLLLKAGTDVNQAAKCDGQTVLHMAARKGCVGVARSLFAYPVDLSARSSSSETPLHLAAWHGHYSMAQLLISQGADVNSLTKLRRTPLHWAAFKGHRKLVILLVQHSASPYQSDMLAAMPVVNAFNNGHEDLGKDIMSLERCKPWFLSYICRVHIRTAIGEDRLDRINELGSRMSKPLRRYLLEDDTNCCAGDSSLSFK